MPPAVKRNFTVVFFDLKASNKDHLLEGLIKLSTYRMFMTKDHCYLLLSNSSATKNSKNIRNVFLLERGIHNNFDTKAFYEFINNTEASVGDPVDFLDIVLLGIEYIKLAIGVPGIITLQIVYFTDLVNQLAQRDKQKISRIIEKLNEHEIFLYVIGPDVVIPDHIAKADDVPACMKRIMLDETNEALVIAKQLVQQTQRGVLSNLAIGINLVLFFKKPRSMQPWLVPMSVGSLLRIPAKTTRMTKKIRLKLRDRSIHNYRSNIYILKEDEEVEIHLQDLIKGVIFHGKFVKIDSEDMFKSETERSFVVIGFTPSKLVSEPYLSGDALFHCVPGAQPGSGNYELFVTLVEILIEQDLCVIMQRIYNKNNNPSFFVLKPKLGPNGPHFVMTKHPPADGIRGVYTLTSLPEKNSIELEDDLFNNFCQSIDIYNDRCRIEFPVSPCMAINTFNEEVIKEAARQICDKGFEFTETEAMDLEAEYRNEYLDELYSSWIAQMMKI